MNCGSARERYPLFHAARRIEQNNSRKRRILSTKAFDLLLGTVLKDMKLLKLESTDGLAVGTRDRRIHQNYRRFNANNVVRLRMSNQRGTKNQEREEYEEFDDGGAARSSFHLSENARRGVRSLCSE